MIRFSSVSISSAACCFACVGRELGGKSADNNKETKFIVQISRTTRPNCKQFKFLVMSKRQLLLLSSANCHGYTGIYEYAKDFIVSFLKKWKQKKVLQIFMKLKWKIFCPQE